MGWRGGVSRIITPPTDRRGAKPSGTAGIGLHPTLPVDVSTWMARGCQQSDGLAGGGQAYVLGLVNANRVAASLNFAQMDTRHLPACRPLALYERVRVKVCKADGMLVTATTCCNTIIHTLLSNCLVVGERSCRYCGISLQLSFVVTHTLYIRS